MVKSGVFYFFLLLSTIGDASAQSSGGTAQAAINVNPDPHNEPWLVSGMKVTPEVLEKLKSIPEWQVSTRGLSKASAASALPDHVYNYKNPEFPPTFAQIGGCCSAASGIGYCYTYESNLAKGTTAASANNICAYGFIYDFIDNGSDGGCWYYDAWDVAKRTGCMSKAGFGGVLEDGSSGMKESKWGNGYQQYHSAYSACRDSDYYIIKVADSTGLTRLKQWMFDHGRGDIKGGVAVFSWYSTHTFSAIPAGMPFAGKKILASATAATSGGVTEHAMTFAGYDDRIGPSSSQLGAVLLQNSWGLTYGDSGHCWVPYHFLSSTSDGIWNNQVYVIDVRPHTVKLDYKVTITHNQRNQIQIKMGYANGLNAASASASGIIGGGNSLGAFNYSGGAYPMEGNGGSPTIEIGLDATDYYNKMTGAQATFFLIVTSKGGTGSIDSFALMDYSNDSVAAEIPCSRKNVAIAAGTTTLSINYTRPAVAAVEGLSLVRAVHDRIRIRGMSVFMPYKGKNTMVVTDMQGRTLKSFQTDGPGWYSLQGEIPKGTYVVSVQHRANAAVTGVFK